MIKHLYGTFVLVFFITRLNAQHCDMVFSGNVKDFHDGSPLIGATIELENSKQYAVTDDKGSFELKNLCPKTYWLIVSHISCETKKIQINVSKETYKEILLEHHFEELKEVTVKGKGVKRTQTSQETVLKNTVLERYTTQSLGDAIKQIPGVSSINTGNSIVKPVINGLHSSRVLVLTNNVRLQDQEWGIEHAPNIDISAAGSISLIKGSNALEFAGDAIGGVIIVNPNRVYAKDSLYGKTVLNAHQNGRGYGMNTLITRSWDKDWFVGGQASYKRAGDFKASDYNLTNTGNELRSFSMNTGFNSLEKGFDVYYSYLKNEIGILRASHIGNVEDLVNAINSQQPLVIDNFTYNINPPKQEVTHQIFKTNFYKRFKRLGKLNIQYDYQNNRRFEFDLRRGDDRNVAAIDLELTTHTFKSTLKLDTNLDQILKVGIFGSYQNNFANPDTGIRRLIPDYSKFDLGLFTIGNFKLHDKLVFDLGIRYDFSRIDAKKFYQISRWEVQGYNEEFSDLIIRQEGSQYLVNPVFNFHNVSASVGMLWNVSEKDSFIFNYGLSSRAPNPSEFFSDGLHHSAARIEIGDLRIRKETSHRVSGTYHYSKNRFKMYIEAFFNRINDFIYIEPTGVETTIRGAFPVWEYKQVNASLFGIDTSLKYQLHPKWNLENKSSLIKGKDLSGKRPLMDIPAFRTITILEYVNKKWSKLNVELQSEWVFRQNEYPDNNFEAYIPRTGEYVIVDISTPPQAYHVLNVIAHLKITDTLQLSLMANNLFNTSYREYLNRLRYFADELGRNMIVQLKFNY